MFGAIARGAKALWHIRGLVKEVKDVINLANRLWAKYDDLDDDAKYVAKELNDVVVKIKAMLGV